MANSEVSENQSLQLIAIDAMANSEVSDNQSLQLLAIDLNKSIYESESSENLHIQNEGNHDVELNEEVEDDLVSISAITEDNMVMTANHGEEICGYLVGETRASLTEIYDLYCQHAAVVGFSVRKAKQVRKVGTTQVTTKLFLCSAAGQRNTVLKRDQKHEKDENVAQLTEESCSMIIKKRKPRRVAITRTNCNALIKAKLNDGGQFEIIQHVMAHNHPLTRQHWNHLHRSERAMTEPKEQVIKAMHKSGFRPSESFRYMSNEAGGENVVGHSYKDHMNFCHKLKIKAIEGGDSQVVYDKLQDAYSEDPNFFFRIRLDQDGRVCNLFWRDSMMLEDYKIYGDVTVFDTTYRTNRYNLVCAPFVGINNHWKNTMFACAFLGDEKTESFVWLFETFKKAMGEKCPVTLFTDQDVAMAKAIKKVFPNTRHRLCLWHLIQNAVARFGVLKSDSTFKATFNKCLSGCLNEAEFNACWEAMITKYNLKEHKWFIRIYKLRHKWATALSKDFFSAGILSSQRSESTNNAVGFKATKKTSLTEFYNIFQETIRRWRNTEDIDEFNSTKSIPTSHYPLTSLLKHAAQVYTHTLFRDFEDEFNLAIASQVQLIDTNGSKKFYQVYFEDTAESAQIVMYDPLDEIIQCPCKNFEESGWLCFHCIRVLHMHSVQKIPEKYISFRWTKFAKVEVWNKKEAKLKAKGLLNGFTPWRLHMLRKYYNLILKSQTIEEARKIIEDSFNKDSEAIETIIAAASNTEQNTTSATNTATENEISVQVLDPAHANTKGKSKKRIPGSYDNLNKGKRRKHREFGSKTPKHLF